jgi:hypothetical protein
MFKDKELRGYIGAGIIFFLVMGLLLFLAFFQIPDSNNDIFKVIVGMLVGSLSVVIYTFIGKNPEEVANLTARNESLEAQVKQIVEQKDKIEKMLRDLQTEVIDKLSVTGESFIFRNLKK